MPLADFHFQVKHIKRSAGQSAVACAAYRACEKLHSDYYNETNDYSRKGGLIHSEIDLPEHVPKEYADREYLWNSVERAEKRKDAQLAYSFDFALMNEFTIKENITIARRFILGEARYSSLTRSFPERAEKLFDKAADTAKARRAHLEKLVKLYGEEE